ncbi:MAG TPA: hypothetical protein VIF34_08605 [Methylocystis sp.]
MNLFNYSVGVRTGVIGKISRKGVACWTTEGQLALPNFARSGSLRGAGQGVDNTFYFSVPDADVRKQLEAIPDGSPVTLEYRQKLFALDWPLPFSVSVGPNVKSSGRDSRLAFLQTWRRRKAVACFSARMENMRAPFFRPAPTLKQIRRAAG